DGQGQRRRQGAEGKTLGHAEGAGQHRQRPASERQLQNVTPHEHACGRSMLRYLRDNPLLWLLVFVPAVLIGEKVRPEAHTVLFVVSVLAIVPLAALLSHATESVAARTGDAVGGLLNA